jgi:hypothetical protein
LVESHQPLTLETIKLEYHKLLELYFGPKFTLDPQLDLECLRIPHFYRARPCRPLNAAMPLKSRPMTKSLNCQFQLKVHELSFVSLYGSEVDIPPSKKYNFHKQVTG